MPQLKNAPFSPTENDTSRARTDDSQGTDWLGERISHDEAAPAEGVALPVKKGALDKGRATESRRGSHN